MWYTRSMIVSPRATSPASTSPALARRSDACTVRRTIAPVPRTTARRPSMEMFAPMRTISLACRKRFSKIVSVITDVPSACVASAMYCACMSVAKAGYSSVVMSAPSSFSRGRTRSVALSTHVDAHSGLLASWRSPLPDAPVRNG